MCHEVDVRKSGRTKFNGYVSIYTNVTRHWREMRYIIGNLMGKEMK